MAYGHLGYPVLQAADILLYKANVVPVGEDQVPHVEITREIARRFNTVFAPVFPEPEARLTPSARFPGLDRRRMSKSLGNVVLLSDSPEEIQKKIRTAYTDPGKVRRNDPGNPIESRCVVYSWHGRFNSAEQPAILSECQSGALGCVTCKTRLSIVVGDEFAAFRERRAELIAAPDRVLGVLEAGRDRAGAVTRATMRDVHEAMGF